MHDETVKWRFLTANFRIEWAIAPESDPDFSFDESGETQEKCASGEWVCFESVVRVIHRKTGATLGEDFLGNSVYENPDDFRDHIGAQGKYGSYFRDMVKTAIAEARKSLAQLQAVHIRTPE